MHLNKPELQEAASELLADLEGMLSWKWDKSFQALLTEFPSGDKSNIGPILEKHLIKKYDKKTIRKAPENLRTSAGLFSNLRSKQLLFASDPEGSVLVFAAWWPWNDEDRISLRILSPDPDAEPPKKPGILSKIIDFIVD